MDEFVWEEDNEEDEEEEGEEPLGLLEQIMEEEEERQNLKPRKRNNVRKPKDNDHLRTVANLRVATPQSEGVPCPACGACDSLYDDVRTGTTVCRGCGAVRSDIAPCELGVPVSSVPGPSARLNYFRERMLQWQCGEPEIPRSGWEALVNAYDDLRDVGGSVCVSDLLTKTEIRAICIHARLPPKNVVEKWLTIRCRLLRHAGLKNDYVAPSTTLVEFCVDRFIEFVRAWDNHPELRRGRTSLVNYNFQMEQYLLMYSVEDYVQHSIWFPQVTAAKREKLIPIWSDFCQVLGWSIYSGEFRPDGTCIRLEQKPISTVTRSARVVRRPRPFESPARHQGTLDRWISPLPQIAQPLPDSRGHSTSQ